MATIQLVTMPATINVKPNAVTIGEAVGWGNSISRMFLV
jgi:hypothetical protein